MILADVLKTLWRMLEPQRRIYFSALVFLLFVSGIFEMAGMLIIFGFIHGLSVNPATGMRSGHVGRLLERLYHRPVADLEFALVGGSLVVIAIVVKNAQSMVVRYQMSRFLANLEHRIALQLFGALAAMPYERVVKTGGRGLQERQQSTLKVLAECFASASQILADGTMLSMVFGLLLFVDPALTGIGVLIFGGLGIGIYQVLQVRLRTMGRLDKDAKGRVDGALRDAFGGLVEARLRDRLGYFQGRYRQAHGERIRIRRREGALRRIPGAANETVLILAITTSVLYMVLSDMQVREALPVLAIFGFAGMRANQALSRMSGAFQSLRQRGERFAERVHLLTVFAPKVLGSSDIAVPSYLADEKPLPPGRDGRLHDTLELRDVTFSYPGAAKSAIQGISLTVRRGYFVSFCGSSGGGKSTLVMLLMGLLRPTTGEVLCDGWDIHDHIRAWQRSIGYVGQSPYLSSATVRENVAFGMARADIDDEKVWAALELAAARRFVENMPLQLDTLLSAEGTTLSGGQRQRIVIARALYHDPDVVVFDEATAALDNVTEQEITDAALRLRRSKTVVCVAHRLSTIEGSDEIHVLENGQLVGTGTYQELLSSNDAFRRLALGTVASHVSETPP